jgi:hypothetical protein
VDTGGRGLRAAGATRNAAERGLSMSAQSGCTHLCSPPCSSCVVQERVMQASLQRRLADPSCLTVLGLRGAGSCLGG